MTDPEIWIGMILSVQDDTLEIIFADRTSKTRTSLVARQFAKTHRLIKNEVFAMYGIVDDSNLVINRVIKLPNQEYEADQLHEVIKYVESVLAK